MTGRVSWLFICALALGFWTATPAAGQQHRATRLGNPATRFAEPLQSPEDLRRLLGSLALQADVESIVKQCGYKGDMEDFRRAASNAPILELTIPVGTRLPAMSSREKGKPVLLHDVLWAGKEPIDAYEFYFVSNDRRYRVIAPKPCANFWVEDRGREPRPALTIQCNTAPETPLGRPTRVCLTVSNTGDAPEPTTTVALTMPADAGLVSALGASNAAEGRLVWEIPLILPGQSSNVCAVFSPSHPGSFPFAAAARGQVSPPADSRCELRVVGVSALLLEKGDDPDPVEVGEETTYYVRVTNQGTADDTNVKVVVEFPKELTPISADNGGSVEGQTVTFPPHPRLAAKAAFEYHVKAKGAVAGDARVKFIRTSTDIPAPTTAEESTRVY